MRYLIYLLIIANLVFFAWYPRPLERDDDRRALPPLPPNVDTLVLLSERDGQPPAGGAPATVDATAADAPAPASVAPELVQQTEPAAPEPAVEARPLGVCQSVGPFREPALADQIGRLLRDAGYQPQRREARAREQTGYWVYLPPMPRRRAREIVADLDAHGMKDYYIGKGNFISLGIFRSRGKAAVRRRKVRRLGYDAILEPRYRNRKVYWLDMTTPGKPLADTPLWDKLVKKAPQITTEPLACP